ncbi:hypothetical protein B9Z55_007453 [Caenorhabditis nigoni]|uniref:Uncharacterized protein n=2 Tax=Caenorhabditis nigoni TaxID=1611254 RepID=A0A2G5V9W1_9PELO|nr:hypothetical protein B9Z55_007453 [Caenorhabditis nigoni]
MTIVVRETKRWTIPHGVHPTRNSTPQVVEGSYHDSRTTEPENIGRILAKQVMLNEQLLETQKSIQKEIRILRQEVRQATRLQLFPVISDWLVGTWEAMVERFRKIGRKAISVARKQPIGYVVAVGVLSLAVVALVADKMSD